MASYSVALSSCALHEECSIQHLLFLFLQDELRQRKEEEVDDYCSQVFYFATCLFCCVGFFFGKTYALCNFIFIANSLNLIVKSTISFLNFVEL